MTNSVSVNIKYLDHYNFKEWGPLCYKNDGDAGFDLRAAIDKPVVLSGLISNILENINLEEEYPDYYSEETKYYLKPNNNYNEFSKYQQIIPCGIQVSIPDGFQMEIRSRSGLSAKYGISIVNSPGTIDSKFRGEIQAILINHGNEDFTINPGDRICQAVLMPYYKAEFNIVDSLEDSQRGLNGLGSSGVK